MQPHRPITFQLVDTATQKLIGSVDVDSRWLPIQEEDPDLPLLSTVDECDPSYFAPHDVPALEAELRALQRLHPIGVEELEAAIILVRRCRATPERFLFVTPFGGFHSRT